MPSPLEHAIRRISNANCVTVSCPICGHESRQVKTKVTREMTLICPCCKALFVIHR
ncbi:YnfU family zinc-binding protein [Dickeya oryzae]|uniref:YnfU family zinc-binding protein n=1 Tax=Dickeya oryzae TaxID=1240404 RepID=A0AB39IHY3_9GAMM|nr:MULTISPECIES: YnfU family zinc-binding protein [Dickeya]MCA6990574.1 YnfU family zinc-binding protein [Dickeya oryzae]MCA6994971.1 YnfU family zinc-binding protein [Dickeya oryzae]